MASVDQVDTGYLETLIGYNARRAAPTVIGLFLERMAVYGLRPVDFSVLSVIAHNPGVTSRQLCTCLGLQPPNLVIMLQPVPSSANWCCASRIRTTGGRWALSLTPGRALMAQAGRNGCAAGGGCHRPDPAQRNTLKRLLKLIYAPPRKADKGDGATKPQHRNPWASHQQHISRARARASARRSGA